MFIVAGEKHRPPPLYDSPVTVFLVTNRYIWHCFTGKQQPTSFRCLACVLITALCSLNKRCLAMENTAKGLETKKYINSFLKGNFVSRVASRCVCIPYWFWSNQKFNPKRFRKSGKVFGNHPNTSVFVFVADIWKLVSIVRLTTCSVNSWEDIIPDLGQDGFRNRLTELSKFRWGMKNYFFSIDCSLCESPFSNLFGDVVKRDIKQHHSVDNQYYFSYSGQGQIIWSNIKRGRLVSWWAVFHEW